MGSPTTTADDILACARTLIVSGGYNGFSYADIADVVGIRKPSIHHHFPTKADLVRTLVSRYRDEAVAGIAAMQRQTSDPLTQLRNYTAYWAACIKDPLTSFCVCALLASELPILPADVALEVKAHFRAISAWLTSVLDHGQQTGVLMLTASPRVEAEAFMATVHGAMLSARAYGEPDVFELVTSRLIDRLSKPQ